MPAIVMAVVAWEITTAAVVEAAMLAVTYVQWQDARGRDNGTSRFTGNGILANTRTSQAPLPVLYGRHRLGGNIVYQSATGADNELLHIIMTLSEGPVDSIEQIYLDDKAITDYGADAAYEFYGGTGNQGVCGLNAYDTDWADTLKFTSYLYIRLKYNRDRFTKVPKITAVARGRKLYDPRTTLTQYSNNPALVWYDYMTNKRYGLGVPTSFIDAQSVIDAANWCDSQPTPFTFNGVLGDRKAFLDGIGDVMRNFRAATIWSGGKYKLRINKFDSAVMTLGEDDIVADSFSFSVPGLGDTPNRVIVKYADEASIDPQDFGWVVKSHVVEDADAVLTFENEERDVEIALVGTTNAKQAQMLAAYNLERSRLNKTCSFTCGPSALPLEPGDIILVTHHLPGWTNKTVRVIDMGVTQSGLVSLTVMEEDVLLYDDAVNLSLQSYYKTNLPNPLSKPLEVGGISVIEELYVDKDATRIRLKVNFTPPDSPFWDHVEVWVSTDGSNYGHYGDVVGSFTIEPAEEKATYFFKFIGVSLMNVKGNGVTYSYSVKGKNAPPADVTRFTGTAAGDVVRFSWNKVIELDLAGYEIRYGVDWLSSIFLTSLDGVNTSLASVKPGTHAFQLKAKDTLSQYSENAIPCAVTVFWPPNYTQKAVNPPSNGDQFEEIVTKSVTSITRSGTTATATVTAHGYVNGQSIQILGATQPEYNGTFKIANVAANTFDYTITGTPASPATGTITASYGGVHSNTEYADHPSFGRVLKLMQNLSQGEYRSPTYDLGSVIKARHWAEFSWEIEGVNASWESIFYPCWKWEDKISAGMTWLALFAAFQAGDSLEMYFEYSTDNVNWTRLTDFVLLGYEVEARYIAYGAIFKDTNPAYNMLLKPVTLRSAYWQ